MSNLDFWNEVSKTDPAHTKKAKLGSGFQITAIDPQYQRKNATEALGMYGDGWGIIEGSETYSLQVITEEDTLCLYQGTMFYCKKKGHTKVRCHYPIVSTVAVKYKTSKGYLKIDNDYAKKAQTDALTKGLSFLGFNADVFEGLFDDNKYLADRADDIAKEKYLNDLLSQIGKEAVDTYHALVQGDDPLRLVEFMEQFPVDDPSDLRREALWESWPKGQKTKMKAKQIRMQSDARVRVDELYQDLAQAIENDDEQRIAEVWDEWPWLKRYLAPHLTEDQQAFLKARKEKSEAA